VRHCHSAGGDTDICAAAAAAADDALVLTAHAGTDTLALV